MSPDSLFFLSWVQNFLFMTWLLPWTFITQSTGMKGKGNGLVRCIVLLKTYVCISAVGICIACCFMILITQVEE